MQIFLKCKEKRELIFSSLKSTSPEGPFSGDIRKKNTFFHINLSNKKMKKKNPIISRFSQLRSA